MRCHHCLRLATDATCPFCGSETASPVVQIARTDFEPALLRGLESPETAADDNLWDLLCLAFLFPPAEARVDARLAEIALADLSPEKHCMVGLYMALRLGDQAQAAAHFVTAIDSGATVLTVGPATFEYHAAEEALLDVTLTVGETSVRLGQLNKESIEWADCSIGPTTELTPLHWAEFLAGIARRTAAVDAVWAAVCTRDGEIRRGDTGFRTLWKDFQHALGEQRDRLEAPAELLELQASLQGRNRQALRLLDVPRCVSTLVESSRNALRIRADALRHDRAHEPNLHAREAFSQAFLDGCMEDVTDLRDELRRETTTAHAELRKALDYQGRLLRSAQEALNGSLAEIARRACSLLWPLSPQHLFDEAREQAELVVERAREVAMIEQTDAYLQNLSPSIESAGNEITAELSSRRNHLERWRQGLHGTANVLRTTSEGRVDESARSLRERFKAVPAKADAMGNFLDKVEVTDPARQAALA